MKTRKCGFTLIELLVVMVIIGVLASILLPVVGKARMAANKSESTSNLREIYMMSMAWTNDNNNFIPAAMSNGASDVWFNVITTPQNDFDKPNGSGVFTKNLFDREVKKLYPTHVYPTYALNMFGMEPGTTGPQVRVNYLPNPSKTVLYSLASPLKWAPTVFGYGNGTTTNGWPSRPYNNTSLINFVDGHIENVKANPARESGLDLPPDAWRVPQQ